MTQSHQKIIEEVSLNAWPCLRQMLYDGWILRFANGYTRRANSVNPIYEGVQDVAEKIRRCEQIYQSKQLRTVFKITPFVHPANLDDVLAESGYEKEAPTSVQTLDLANISAQTTYSIQQWAKPAPEWVDHFGRMNKVAPENVPALRAILDNIAAMTCFATVQNEDQTVSCGLGVLDGNHVGFFDIVTDPAHRGKGFGTGLMLNILHWAKQNGATKAYLQVMLNNPPALNLYEKLGFKEIYQYWYRVK